MKHIEKQSEPDDFVRWKQKYPDATYSDLGRDKKYPGAQKARWCLRASLVNEQKGLCCYCETRIDNGDFHVEHFYPKAEGLFPALQLEYLNLHACCRKQASGGVDDYCGHKKANQFSPNLISPLMPDCSKHFQYDMAGGVVGVDVMGSETVSILNLNSILLQRSRKNLIEYFEDLNDSEYSDEIARHLDPDANPLGEFYTTIEYLHEKNLLQ